MDLLIQPCVYCKSQKCIMKNNFEDSQFAIFFNVKNLLVETFDFMFKKKKKLFSKTLLYWPFSKY